MDIDVIAREITDRIEKFKNKDKLTWKEVYTRELDNLKDVEDKDLVLVRVVKEISRRGYIIEDNPFKLTR